MYLQIFFILSPPSNFVKRELLFLSGLKSSTHICYCSVNHTVVMMCADCAKWSCQIQKVQSTQNIVWSYQKSLVRGPTFEARTRARISASPLPVLLGLALMTLDHCQPSGHFLCLVGLDAFFVTLPSGLSAPNLGEKIEAQKKLGPSEDTFVEKCAHVYQREDNFSIIVFKVTINSIPSTFKT